MKRILVQVTLLVLLVSAIALAVRKTGSDEPAELGLGLTAVNLGQSALCMQDVQQTGLRLAFNPVTGAYTFSRCSPALTLTGTGTVRTVNSTVSLTDSKPDRRVSAGFLEGQNTGTASVTIVGGAGVSQNFKINSTSPNPLCGCP